MSKIVFPCTTLKSKILACLPSFSFLEFHIRIIFYRELIKVIFIFMKQVQNQVKMSMM